MAVRTDLWVPLDPDAPGHHMPRPTVIVWLWRYLPDHPEHGYWAQGQLVSDRWFCPGGSHLTWKPTWWQPIQEPAGPPPGEGSGT